MVPCWHLPITGLSWDSAGTSQLLLPLYLSVYHIYLRPAITPSVLSMCCPISVVSIFVPYIHMCGVWPKQMCVMYSIYIYITCAINLYMNLNRTYIYIFIAQITDMYRGHLNTVSENDPLQPLPRSYVIIPPDSGGRPLWADLLG